MLADEKGPLGQAVVWVTQLYLYIHLVEPLVVTVFQFLYNILITYVKFVSAPLMDILVLVLVVQRLTQAFFLNFDFEEGINTLRNWT